MIKKITFLILTIGCVWFAAAQDQVLGKWLSQDKLGIVEIYKENNQYFGKIVWLQNPNQRDVNNKIKELKSRPLLHLVVIQNLKHKNNEWSEGIVYDPKKGKTFACKIWIENNTLKVRGYLGFLYSTETWTRAD